MAYAEDHLSDNREAQELSFITPGNSTPYGKSRVFFCGHPEDHAVYFEPVREWIWKYNRNTAFWYEDPKKGSGLPLEELYARLSEMNLIVMPVTTKLLTKTNRAVEVILPYAEEKHIPILPLMMEEGLDELFSNVFGSLQYLKPLEKDPTSVPFEQKLEKYIRGVLIGDEQAQMIRDAFDAYIFLSYRKKDRAYAQELMEMIHRNPRFRDIAIWYDEYLVPGENFNETIRHMLEKSDVFGLVVTPSLLEYMDGAPNYVMANEYPAARACGKPILPMEKAATDRMRLEKLYPGIPDCASTEADTEAYLTEQLRGVALAENDEDPQHNFLIGLAYLDGIDVEVDSGKALKLITGAAEEGLEEAIRKLVAMYHDGKGVERDYAESARWQEKLVALLRKGYESGKYKPEDRRLVSALWDLGDAYYSLGNHRKALAAYQEMQSVAEQSSKVSGTVEGRRDLSVSYDNLGDIAQALGNLAEAKKWFEQGFAISAVLAEETGTVEARRDLSVSYDKLGDIARALGDPAGAKKWFEQGFAISAVLAEETGTVEARRDLWVSYNKLGDIAQALGDPAGAKNWFEQGLAISAALAEETGTVEARRDLSVSYNRLGDIAQALGNLAEAKKWFEQGLAIRSALAEETGTVEARRDLWVSYNKLGDIARALGDPAGAKKWFEQGFAISAVLAEETGTVEARRDLWVSYNKLGDIAQALGDPVGAKKWFEQGLAISAALAEETGTVEARRDLSVSYERLGGIARVLGDPVGAKKWFEQGLAIRSALAEETGTVEARRNLSISYDRLGNIAKALGDPAGAKKWFEQGLAISTALAEETGTVEARRDLSVSYDRLGDIAQALGDPAGAKKWFEQGLAIRSALAEETGTVEARRNLSVSYDRLGNIAKALGDPAGAKNWYEQGLAIRSALAEETGTLESYDDLAVSYFKLGILGDMDSMREAYAIWKKLAEDYPEVGEYKRRRDIAKGELERP